MTFLGCCGKVLDTRVLPNSSEMRFVLKWLGYDTAMSNMSFGFIGAELVADLLLFQMELPAAEAHFHSCCLVQHHYE